MARIGISGTTLEPKMLGLALDGIGTYTHHLINTLHTQFNIRLYPRSFYRGGLWGSSKSELPNGTVFPLSYSLATLTSLILRKPVLKTEVSLYHTTDYRIPKLNCPLIATLHDATLLRYPQWIRTGLRPVKGYIVKRTTRWLSHVIALSKAMIPDLVEYFGIPPEKISVIHLGVDESWFQKIDETVLRDMLKNYGLSLDKGYFLFVGTLQPRKNIQRIIQAYLNLPKSLRQEKKLVLVGREGWGKEDFSLLETALKKEEIIWLNYVPEADLKAIYQGASVFVFPSLYEGFGIPLLEAFASGVPVVTSNISAMPEVSDGAGLEVDPHSVEEISSAMQRLVEDEKKREECIARGFVRARETTWKECARKTLDLYRQWVDIDEMDLVHA